MIGSWTRMMLGNPDIVARVENFARRLTRKKFGFAVGTPAGHYSSVWYALGQKSDYYIGTRSFMGSQKISLHRTTPTSTCRLALSREQLAELKEQWRDAPDDRAFVEWRHELAPVDGFVHVVSLIFPTDYLRQPPPKKKFEIYDAAPPGSR
jgi:hypothetical protein